MQQQNIIPFTTQDTDPIRVLQFRQEQIMQSTSLINANVMNTSNVLADHLQKIEKKLQNVEKKRRRSCVSESLAF